MSSIVTAALAFLAGLVAYRAGTRILDQSQKHYRRGLVGYYQLGAC